MEPKNGGLEDDFPFQLFDFQVPSNFSRVYPEKHMGTPEAEEDFVPCPPLLKGFLRHANILLPSHSPNPSS